MPADDLLYAFANRYVTAPQWIRTLAGRTYAMLPPSVRFGAAYDRFCALFEERTIDRDDCTRRLAATLTTALMNVAAYRRNAHLLPLATSAPEEVLGQLPTTSKEQIKLDLGSYISIAHGPRDRLRTCTGGSTSVPMTFYLHKRVTRAKEWAAFHALGRRHGTQGDGVILALRGRTVDVNGGRRFWSYDPVKRHLILSSDHLEPQFMPRYVSVLRRWRPKFIHAFPSALFPLLTWLREHDEEALLEQVDGVLLTSESVFEHHLRAFKSFFHCPVILQYGHSERVLFAHTLHDDERYHFWPHYGHFELLDANGAAVTTPGQAGEIVGTSLDNAVMPFVRYRTGDYAVLSERPHPSMSGCPVVERIEGRLQEFVVCRDHRLVTITTLGSRHFAELDKCLRIQFEQREAGRLLLKVMPLQPLSDSDRARLARAVTDKTQGGCTVEVVEVESVPTTSRGKQRLLVQHLDVGAYLGSAMNTVPGPLV